MAIQRPIGKAQVANVLGTRITDIGYLCSNAHGRTNKWSKAKPTVFGARLAPLDEDATQADQNLRNGSGYPADLQGRVRYGLVCRPRTTALADMHTCDYRYIAPQASPTCAARISDFIGYNHHARLDVAAWSASDQQNVDTNTGELLLAIVEVGESIGSITFRELVSQSVDWKNYYPCVLVSSSISATYPNGQGNWAKAMTWGHGETLGNASPTPRPVQYGGVTENLFKVSLADAPVGLKARGAHRVSFFLASAVPTGWQSWVPVSTSTVYTQTFVALPGACGLAVNMVNPTNLFAITCSCRHITPATDMAYDAWSVTITQLMSNGSNGGFEPGQSITYTLRVTIGGVQVHNETSTREAGQPWTLMGTHTSASASGGGTIVATLTYGGRTYTGSAIIQ